MIQKSKNKRNGESTQGKWKLYIRIWDPDIKVDFKPKNSKV